MRLWDLPSCRAPSFLLAPAIPLFSFTALISNRLPSRRRKTSPGIGPGIFPSARSIAIISNATKVSRCWCSTPKMRAPTSRRGARRACKPTRRLISHERRRWLTAKRSRSAFRSPLSAIRPRPGSACSPASITRLHTSRSRAICSTPMAQRQSRMSGSWAKPRPILPGSCKRSRAPRQSVKIHPSRCCKRA